MTEKEMFEKSFERPSNFFKLSAAFQWEIDKSLGILDWEGEDLTDLDIKRFRNHYKKIAKPEVTNRHRKATIVEKVG
jgi:hypothetical protein